MTRVEIISNMIHTWEGVKYENHPNDKGGPTKFGITLATLRASRGIQCSADDVRNLEEAEAIAIFSTKYWDKHRVDMFPEGLRTLVFDLVVQHGKGIWILQRALVRMGVQGFLVDNVSRGKTWDACARAVTEHGLVAVNNAICDERERYYRGIVERDVSQDVFLNGWLRRCKSFRMNDAQTKKVESGNAKKIVNTSIAGAGATGVAILAQNALNLNQFLILCGAIICIIITLLILKNRAAKVE